MNPTLVLVVWWAAGIALALAAGGAAAFWLFFDTSTGKVPDRDRIARSREYLAEHWSLEAEANHEAVCEEEYGGCRRETRWRRFRKWLFGRRPG